MKEDFKTLFSTMGVAAAVAAIIFLMWTPTIAYGASTEIPEMIAAPTSLAEAVAVVSNVSEARKSGEGMFLAVAALLALLFKVLLSTLRFFAKEAPWLKTQKGKAWVRMLTLALGALAGFTAALALEMPWTEAFVIGFSGPLSVATHEYSKIAKMLTGTKDA